MLAALANPICYATDKLLLVVVVIYVSALSFVLFISLKLIVSIFSASEAFMSCISINVTEDCTEKMADLATNMHKAWHSYSACGPVHSAFLHKYDGDLECDSSPQLHVAMTNILMSVAVYFLIKF